MLFRLPVITPALHPQEAAMVEMLQQVELEESMLNDHELKFKWEQVFLTGVKILGFLIYFSEN